MIDGVKLRERFLALELSGANVTVPHKEDAFMACDEVRGFAKEIKVVNTIVNENGKLIGYNTDADGFVYAIKEFENIKSILIIGAGGTAKALSLRLVQDGFCVDVLNRSSLRFDDFKNSSVACFTWSDFKPKRYDLVVNTTSAGLSDDEYPAPKIVLEEILNNCSFVFDVIYGKVTPFLRLAKEKGIVSKDGSDMLLAQGVIANHLLMHKKIEMENIKPHMQRSFSF